MKNKIKGFAKQLGIDQTGICAHPEQSGCCIVCLFPYFAGFAPGNLSLYARGQDYHQVCRSYLLRICAYMQSLGLDDYSAGIYCDTGPYNERILAVQSGLGFLGKNQCLINEVYGSYCFIGLIACPGLELELDEPCSGSCLSCNRCLSTCPGGALREDGFFLDNCLSHISQRKGTLSPKQESLLRLSPLIWGCDLCQKVCPHNQNVPITPFHQFRENLICSLEETDLEGLSNRAFQKKYAGRAFTWRGKGVLMRNIQLKTE